MAEVTIHVDGLAEIMRRLYQLPDKVEARVVRRGLVTAARVIRDEAKVRAPEWHGDVADGAPPPGTLKRNIYVKYVPEESRGGFFTYFVGVRSGKKLQHVGKKGINRDAYYWWWVELGHYTRTANALNVRNRGGDNKRTRIQQSLAQAGTIRFIPGQRFMRDAFAARGDDALETAMTTMRDGILAVAQE